MPYERYRRDLQREGFQHDPAQEQAVRALQKVYDQLMAQPTAAAGRRTGLLARLAGRDKPATPSNRPVRGLYLWGGVGRGKTYLVDTFVDALPLARKQR
ncbi:MAG TPA: AFG1/ZapE family ATPase, partial [Candidatus Competibacteraceae bacterium]|nr:AFG1/ZapE family ATPase [Candidatus Competibacteraceae bacterium]